MHVLLASPRADMYDTVSQEEQNGDPYSSKLGMKV